MEKKNNLDNEMINLKLEIVNDFLKITNENGTPYLSVDWLMKNIIINDEASQEFCRSVLLKERIKKLNKLNGNS